MTTFQVQINGGPTQTLETKTGQYKLAAMAALAMLEYEENKVYDVVKIWVNELLPDHDPYFYAFDGHQVGRPDKYREW